jgi:hypothetical protein
MFRYAAPLVLGLVVWTTPSIARADADEEAVREAFTAFQTAVKAGDPEKIWPLLDRATQAAAERSAKILRDSFGKAGEKEKADLQKSTGLSAEELGKLTGKTYLKSKRFLAKYDEVPGSKLAMIVVQGDKATIHYVEADGDKEKLPAVRQDGKWKLSVRVN